MNRKPDNREYSHARRRPSSVSRNGGQQNVSRSGANLQTGVSGRQNGSRQNAVPQRDSRNTGYTFRAGQTGQLSRSAPPAPQRNVTALTRKDEKKLAKIEKNEIREAEWQKSVVRTRSTPDPVMLALILILLALGTIMVFSASYPLAIRESRPSDYYIKRQLLFLIGGGIVMLVVMIMPPKMFAEWDLFGKIHINTPKVAFVVSCGFLAYALVGGLAEGVTMRWVSIGGFFNLQPSELMKISMILMMSWYASKYEHEIMTPLRRTGKRSKKFNVFYPMAICAVGCGMILVGRHLSGTVITAAIAFFLLIIGGIKVSWFLAAAVPIAGGVIGAFLILFPYALERITTMFDKNADKLDEAWQTTQSVYAIGSGGLFGVRLGESRQKYGYLGNAHTDFIFSIWCEELGFIGAVALIVLFLVFIWRGYVIAVKAPDKFTMMTAFGITTHVGLQAFLNMAVASDLIPNTGITLPFFSYGGSSMFVLMIEMGMLLSISRQSYRKKTDLERDRLEARMNF